MESGSGLDSDPACELPNSNEDLRENGNGIKWEALGDIVVDRYKTISCSKLMCNHGEDILRIEFTILVLMMLIPIGMASENITPDEIMAGNADIININGSAYVYPTTSEINETQDNAGNLTEINESNTYTYTTDVGNIKDVGLIKVHFKNAFRGADQNLATVDWVWQVSDTNSSQLIINDSHERIFSSGTPLKLAEGYELAIMSIDIDGVSMKLELSKNGEVVDSTIIILPEATNDHYVYSTDLGSAKDIEIIKVYFKNAFRGADQNIATVDRIWQVSDTNYSQIINNNSDRLTLTSSTPLTLGEGYELAIKSIDISGKRVYVELSKNGHVIDSTIIMPPAWYNNGLTLYSQGKYDEAISAFDKAIELDPEFARLWNDKGEALSQLGKYDEAIKAFDEAIRLDQNQTQYYWYLKGLALEKVGRNSEAKTAFAKVPYMPKWMEFVTFTRGQGFEGLLILYDKDDDETSFCDGKLRIDIYEDREYKKKLWSKSFEVYSQDFSEYTWGINRKANSWHLKRISYDEIEPGVENPTWYVRAYFDSPDGSVLKDTEMI